MQLEVFQHLLKRHPTCDYKLILIGGARNKEDLDRVEFLKNLAMEFKIQVNRHAILTKLYFFLG